MEITFLNIQLELMDPSSALVGNPITLLIERVAYLFIGIFFIIALYKGIKSNNEEDD